MHRLGLTDEMRESGQAVGGVLALRTGRRSQELVEQWLALCIEDSYHLLDDSPSVRPNSPAFRAHRHDQAILSGLVKLAGLPMERGEVWTDGDWTIDAAGWPVWALRNRTGIAFRPNAPQTLAYRADLARHRWSIRMRRARAARRR